MLLLAPNADSRAVSVCFRIRFAFSIHWLYNSQTRMSPEQRFRRLLSLTLTPLLPEVEHLNIRVYEPAKE